jgi:hypothetical protein
VKTRAEIFAVTVSAVAIAATGASTHRPVLGAAGAQTAVAMAERSPVVLELFTSEGCSSCPPVDAFLSKLEAKQPVPGVEIIALEEHVDYWNQDGWEDPFSGQEWTLRQQEYVAKFKGATPYTPQIILNGEKVVSLKSGAEVQKEILEAAKEEKAEVSIAVAGLEKSDTPKFEVHVGSLRGGSAQEKADVWVAVTEDGLRSDVKAGENNGKTLEHAAVVRSLQKIGATAKGAAPFAASTQVKLKSNWKKENLKVVVLVQDRKSWRILGAATTKVS